MSTCPKCGGMTGLHHSVLPGCMCDFANSIQEIYTQKFLSKVPDTMGCKTHPDAPHGFLRNASHNADRYVCECEHWQEENT